MENWFGFGLKEPNRQKYDIYSDGFPTETTCSPQLKLKVTKITLLAFNYYY